MFAGTIIVILRSCAQCVLGSKQFGHEGLLVPLVADVSISVLGKGKVMKVANVHVAKLIGATSLDSTVVQGVVITRNNTRGQ